jgi:hypothetical protein
VTEQLLGPDETEANSSVITAGLAAGQAKGAAAHERELAARLAERPAQGATAGVSDRHGGLAMSD